MKRCPSCSRTFTDVSLNFCLEDGTPLVNDTAMDPGATLRYDSRETAPPATEIYSPRAPVQTPRTPVRYETPSAAKSPPISNQWSPLQPMPAQKKSNAVWWIVGGIVVAGIVVVGVAVMILALASMGSNGNSNTNTRNSNARVTNRNTNTNNSNLNTNASLPSSKADDFSDETWGKGNFSYGDISYVDGEYRMKAKENSYLVMYAPSNDFSTENARVRVTAQDVDGGAVSSGYGLIVHGQKDAAGQLNDYALLIFTGDQPQYQIVKHKAGVQTTVVPWTKSSAILTGTGANQLEVRARGAELSFYINGQQVNRITDNEIKKGVAGFYTSGISEVAFDNLEIKR
ncbi:MAG: DUF1080 domain-containing protein [Pyrinomonadaceae bacterium]|nr:DUF1080 domain-containing protein [Pyrinomonadaceae bacterium]